METELIKQKQFILTMITEKDIDICSSNKISTFKFQPSEISGIITLRFETDKNGWIIWPNREGERFKVARANRVLRELDRKYLSIVYPSTASCRTFIFGRGKNECFLLAAPPDSTGRVTEFRVKSEGKGFAEVDIITGTEDWYFCYSDNGMEKISNLLEQIKERWKWNCLFPRKRLAGYQVQVGLIKSNGECNIPEKKGYLILPDIADLMEKRFGEGNILHLFGYGRGHDTGYPDYSPSAELGGEKGLGNAIEGIHSHRQKAVFYMNGRLAEKRLVEESKELENAVFKNEKGQKFLEEYDGREFYVMDPSSGIWRERLTKEAGNLKNLGADGVQLDQLGGRIARTEPGKVWGEGYIKLIRKIQGLGLQVWIQGLSDIYPADWFEATYRDVSISGDGTIRGGNPFGESAPELYIMTVPGQTLLVPLSKRRMLPDNYNFNIILDIEEKKASLFFYDEDYIGRLSMIIDKMKQTL